ncbi:MAG: hypothetical protein IH987_06640 [Planctomycetes bacterium]|nr:hypothetical protein [Planctomycetota bacterium]
MANNSRNCLISLCAICYVVLAAGCDFTSRITFFNRTGDTMTPYPVIVDDTVDPPTARREARPGENLAPTESVPIPINGFNPVFYVPGIDDESLANGVYIGLGLFDADPIQIQYKVFHYRVPPGEASGDPDQRPILLQEDIVAVEDVNITIAVRAGEPSPDGWNIMIRERP